MALLDFVGLRAALGNVKNRLAELDRDIAKLEGERASLVRKPLPFEDFLAWVDTRYDHLGDRYEQKVIGELLGPQQTVTRFYMGGLDHHDSLDAFRAVYADSGCPVRWEMPYSGMGSQNAAVSDDCFFYALREPIKAGVRAALTKTLRPRWPKDVGPPRKERIAVLEKMETKLSELLAERERIRGELSQAGVA